jgi:hypothetical protein
LMGKVSPALSHVVFGFRELLQEGGSVHQ